MSIQRPLQHLLTMKSLSRDIIEKILNKADRFLKKVIAKNATTDSLKGRIVANLFFEPSTRTRNSFIIAAKRLNATVVLNPSLPHCALAKGESLLDTIWTFEAMGVSDFIIRHAQRGIPEWIAQELKTSAVVINAGDGANQHPTQALIDLLTIRQHKKSWSSLTVAIVGDIIHSRAAHSLIDGLTIMGVPKIHLVAPTKLLPDHEKSENIKRFDCLEDGIKGVDIIVTSRIQKERYEKLDDTEFKFFQEHFCLTAKKLTLAKPDAIVMHPGPMNRGIEIVSEVADGPQSFILQQVKNSIAVRMAIFDILCT